jgi:hypothetical protein
MFKIIYKPSGTLVSEHATIEDAELALVIAETVPSSHEIIEIPDEEITLEETE